MLNASDAQLEACCSTSGARPSALPARAVVGEGDNHDQHFFSAGDLSHVPFARRIVDEQDRPGLKWPNRAITRLDFALS